MPSSVRELPLRHAVALGLLHGPTELPPISPRRTPRSCHGWPAGPTSSSIQGCASPSRWRCTRAQRQPCCASPARAPVGKARLSGRGVDAARADRLCARRTDRAKTGNPSQDRRRPAGRVGRDGGAEVYKKWHAPRARGGHRHFESNTTPVQIDTKHPTASDGLALGLAQALALIPGVSRSGATFAAARVRGFSHEDADQLSWTVGLPVIAGATLLGHAPDTPAGTTRQTARSGTATGGGRSQRIPLHARRLEGTRSTPTRPTATGLYRLQRRAGGLCDPADAR